MKKIHVLILIIIMSFFSLGCIQEKLYKPLGALTGNVSIAANYLYDGSNANIVGVKVNAIDESDRVYSTYITSVTAASPVTHAPTTGIYTLSELPSRYQLVYIKEGNYYLAGRPAELTYNSTVTVSDITLHPKVTGKARFTLFRYDFSSVSATNLPQVRGDFTVGSAEGSTDWSVAPLTMYDDGGKGPDGAWGVSGVDDDGNGTVDDVTEREWTGSDDSGDDYANDNVYTAVTYISSGEHKYRFFVDNELKKDPHSDDTSDDDSVIVVK